MLKIHKHFFKQNHIHVVSSEMILGSDWVLDDLELWK